MHDITGNIMKINGGRESMNCAIGAYWDTRYIHSYHIIICHVTETLDTYILLHGLFCIDPSMPPAGL